MKKDLYRTVTDQIVAELERGTIPWIKPWKAGEYNGAPMNATTLKRYRGINVPMLLVAAHRKGYGQNKWLTFKQAGEFGGRVKAGEKATQIYFYKPLAIKDRETDQEKRIPLLREFHVFNVEQCEGLPEIVAGAYKPQPQPILDSAFDAAMTATRAIVKHGGDRAFYTPAGDFVQMPMPADFKDLANYRATLAHEIVHWSGHKSRLDRDLRGRFGTNAYAAEELIAEMGAAFMCAHFGIAGDLRHASYLASWIKVLKSDSRAIFTAASKAQAACDYLVPEMAGYKQAEESSAEPMALAA